MLFRPRTLPVLLVGTALGLSLSMAGLYLTDRHEQDRPVSAARLFGADELRLLDEVLARVRREYVDALDGQVLVESAIRGILEELDGYSRYLDAADFSDLMIDITGQYEGIGVALEAVDDRPTIVSVIDGSPAHRSGVRVGDIVLRVDGLAVDTTNLAEARMQMRGHPGSTVALLVLHSGDPQPYSYELTRERIAVASVFHETLPDGTGYVRIAQFTQNTAIELREAVAQLQRSAAGGLLPGLILDLRDNPGGVLDAAVGVADAFLMSGLIVRGEGRLEGSTFQHYARGDDILGGAPLIVLVNARSASAAEIVAAALQDHGRAVLVGTTTYGKGSVQTVMPLPDGTAIKLTTSRYFTAGGATLHEQGIRPDVEIAQAAGDFALPFDDGVFDRDAQLQEALRRLHTPVLALELP